MQDTNKNPIDTRTFVEIWQSLGQRSQEQLDLRDALIAKLRLSRQTINNWGNGKSKPMYDGIKKSVAETINKIIGIKCSYRHLFPLQ